MAKKIKVIDDRLLIFDVISQSRLTASMQRQIYAFNRKKSRGTYYYYYIPNSNNDEAYRNFKNKLNFASLKVRKDKRHNNIIHIDSHGGLNGLYITDKEIHPYITWQELNTLLTNLYNSAESKLNVWLECCYGAAFLKAYTDKNVIPFSNLIVSATRESKIDCRRCAGWFYKKLDEKNDGEEPFEAAFKDMMKRAKVNAPFVKWQLIKSREISNLHFNEDLLRIEKKSLKHVEKNYILQ